MSCTRRPEKRNYRVVVLGSSGVGKTSIISTFLYHTFPDKYKETIDDIHRHSVIYDSMDVTIDILDTCGSHEFPAMRTLSIRTGDAFLLVYSTDKPESFDIAKEFLKEITELKENNDYFVFVIENKSDLCRKETCQQALNELTVCLDWRKEFYKTSAKTGENVEHVFAALEQKIKARLHEESIKLPQQRRFSLPTVRLTGGSVRKLSLKKSFSAE